MKITDTPAVLFVKGLTGQDSNLDTVYPAFPECSGSRFSMLNTIIILLFSIGTFAASSSVWTRMGESRDISIGTFNELVHEGQSRIILKALLH